MPCHKKTFYALITCMWGAHLFWTTDAQAAGESWYLSTNQIALRTINRYFASIDVTNDGQDPVYVRSSVDRLSLVRGARVRTRDTDQSLTISPDEFVVPPKSSVTVRVFAKPGMQADATSQSYYVTLRDTSSTQSTRDGSNTGFVLAYEFLVAVAPLMDPPPRLADFEVDQTSDAHYTLTNKSGRHLFIDDGYACQNTTQPLVKCQAIPKFPKQSLLPLEALPFEAIPNMQFLGFLAFDNLNFSGGQRAYIQGVSRK